MEKLRILIADDQELTREGLRTIVELEDDMVVVGTARNGLEAYEKTAELRPDLVMMDIQMPVENGIAGIKRIKRDYPDVVLLILTTFMDDHYIVDGLAGGASGYILKDMDGDKMIEAIRDAHRGQFVLSGAVASRLAARLSLIADGEGGARRLSSTAQLTDREREIAVLISQGFNNRAIAAELQIREGTVRNYISTLYGKLDVSDRAQAILRLRELL